MLRDLKTALIRTAALAIFLSPCPGGALADEIRIVSVDPSEGLRSGARTTFHIVVQYQLESKEEGEISISLGQIVQDKRRIRRGSGQESFDVTVVPEYSQNTYKAGASLYTSFGDSRRTSTFHKVPLFFTSMPACLAKFEGGREGKPGLVFGAPTILGAMEREDIDKELCGVLEQIYGCWSEAGPVAGWLGDALVIRLVIGPDGSLLTAEVDVRTTRFPSAPGCVSDHLDELRFPRPPGGGLVTVDYPIRVRPTGS